MQAAQLHYLQLDNMTLRKQVQLLGHLSTYPSMSQPNKQSLAYQLASDNFTLRAENSSLRAELLLEKQARQIEFSEMQQTLHSYDQYILQANLNLKTLEQLLVQSPPAKSPSIFSSFFTAAPKTLPAEANFSNTALLFQLMQEILSLQASANDWTQIGSDSMPSEISEELNQTTANLTTNHTGCKQTSNTQPWFSQPSKLYFLKKKQSSQLYLNLEKAKAMQFAMLNSKDSDKTNSFSDPKLLKQSYLKLLADYQLLKDSHRTVQRYIHELEARNQLLIDKLSRFSQSQS